MSGLGWVQGDGDEGCGYGYRDGCAGGALRGVDTFGRDGAWCSGAGGAAALEGGRGLAR